MTNESKWLFNPAEGDNAISVEGSDDIVFYINDINVEVISKVVEMKNDEYSLKKIEGYLDTEVNATDSRLTPEEAEEIMEEINNYLNMIKSQPTITSPTIPVQEEKPLEVVKPSSGIEAVVIPTEKKTRAPKTTGNGTGKKKVSLDTLEATIEEQIKALTEKKQLLTILKQVEAPELPENMTNAGRKLMLELQKEYRQLMDKYAEAINEMN